ncbi:TRAP transporter substrate-binding protein [Tistrella bauzanensis]|uniref:TRAP transporter substrate-binding protein n=1 Tax=Tistrella arctica TaxID=3133430 RepID=A0ABU9YFG8_9PROT
MNRRSFLRGGVAAAAATTAAAAGGIAAPAIAQSRIEWRMVTSWPKNFPGVGTSAARLAERIEAMSAGRLVIKVFGAGELVPAFGTFDAVQQGAAECYHSPSYYFAGKNPGLTLFTSIPLGMTAWEAHGWWLHAGGEAFQDEMTQPFGIKAIPCINTGVQAAGWFSKEIKSIEDLKGLKMRTAGLNAEILRRIGVNVVTLPPGEIFQAMQSGTVDAAEWIGPWNDLAFGLHRLTKNYYVAGVNEPCAVAELGMSMARWNELPDDLKAIVRSACGAEYEAAFTEYFTRNTEAMEVLKSEHGVQVRAFPDEVQQAMADGARAVALELRDRGDDVTKRAWQSYFTYLQQARAYGSNAEGGYLALRAKFDGIPVG